MKILIVEDERKTGEYLRQGLSEAGFVTDLARDGVDGRASRQPERLRPRRTRRDASRHRWLEVLQRIRAAGRTRPVLFLTARDQVNDRVKGLELAPTTTSSSRSLSRNCSPRVRTLLRRGLAVNSSACRWQTSNSTCCVGASCVLAVGSISLPRSSHYSSCCCVGRAKCCRAR